MLNLPRIVMGADGELESEYIPTNDIEEISLLTPDQFFEVEQVYELCDMYDEGIIRAKYVNRAMRLLGFKIEPELLHEFRMEFEVIDDSDHIDFQKFCEMSAYQYERQSPNDELLNAFTILDPDKTGRILAKDLRKNLTTIGNPLKASETEKFLESCGIDEEGFVLWEGYMMTLASIPTD